MEHGDIYNYAEHSYQQVQNRWMNFHLRLLPICTFFLAVIEIIMFFVIKEANSLLHSYLEYFFLYILFPVLSGIVISISGYLLIKHTNLSTSRKQYIISYLFMFFSFIMAWVHSGFIVALLTVNFPILFTVMYEDYRLTSSLTFLGVIIIIFTAFSKTFDYDKVINAYYIINLVMCVLLTLITWLTCYFMIKFIHLKKEVIINNDIQRYELRNQIMIDNLTGVGSRRGLNSFMEETIAKDVNNEYCLIMLDIDDFKGINDHQGHLYGDYVLKEIGMMMNNIDSYTYRYGGDEFVLIFINRSYQFIESDINKLFVMVKEQLDVSLSAGAVVSKDEGFNKMLYYADKALYKSKAIIGSKLTLYQE